MRALDQSDLNLQNELGNADGAIRDLLRENERLRAALASVKSWVVGDKNPNWTNDTTTYITRGKIADVCDLALDPSLRESG